MSGEQRQDSITVFRVNITPRAASNLIGAASIIAGVWLPFLIGDMLPFTDGGERLRWWEPPAVITLSSTLFLGIAFGLFSILGDEVEEWIRSRK